MAEAVGSMLRMRELERATGVGRETIRYYIREGLLPEPERRGPNVALYPQSFVERVRMIKDLQRTRFLPLHVIKAVLNSGALPSAQQTRALMELDGRVFAPGAAAGVREPAGPVAEKAGVPLSDLDLLAEAGAIAPHTGSDGQALLDADDADVVAAWGAMRAAGFSEDLGFSPADLRVHTGMLDVLIGEELRLFTGRIAGLSAQKAAAMAEVGIEQVGRILAVVRRKKILAAIAEAAAARAAKRTKTA